MKSPAQISILLSASSQIIICYHIRGARHLHIYEAGVHEILELGLQSGSPRFVFPSDFSLPEVLFLLE